MKNKEEIIKKLLKEKLKEKNSNIIEIKIAKPSKIEDLEDSIIYRFLKIFKVIALIAILMLSWALTMEHRLERVYLSDFTTSTTALTEPYTGKKYFIEDHTFEKAIAFIFYSILGIIATHIAFNTIIYILFGNMNKKR